MLRIVVTSGKEGFFIDHDTLFEAVGFFEVLVAFYAETGRDYSVHLVYADSGEDVSENTKTYPFITAWGRYMGSFQYYIDQQIALAMIEDAPEDAIYRAAMSGEWVRMADVTSQHAIDSIRFILSKEGVAA